MLIVLYYITLAVLSYFLWSPVFKRSANILIRIRIKSGESIRDIKHNPPSFLYVLSQPDFCLLRLLFSMLFPITILVALIFVICNYITDGYESIIKTKVPLIKDTDSFIDNIVNSNQKNELLIASSESSELLRPKE